MSLRQRLSPGADRFRAQVSQTDAAEVLRRLREQPAELRDRRRRRLMNLEVLLNKLRKR
jgi:hypothetical protein